MNDMFYRIFELARPYLDTRENELHTRIAYGYAERLLRSEPGNPDVVLPAVILHDVGWKRVPEDLQLTAFGPGKKDRQLNRVHEEEGAKIARDLLERVNYPGDLIEEIVLIVLGHDSTREAMSLNDAIVKDSDKLWRYSERGLIVDAARFQTEVSRHLELLWNEIDKWFLTPTGRRIAREEYRLRVRSLNK